jgi:hypothetical protein
MNAFALPLMAVYVGLSGEWAQVLIYPHLLEVLPTAAPGADAHAVRGGGGGGAPWHCDTLLCAGFSWLS